MLKKIFGVKSDVNIGVQDNKSNVNIRTIDYYKISSSLLRDITNIMKSELDESKLHIENIPEKKLNNVVNIYNIDKSKVVALYDTTVFKSGKDGLLLGNDFIGLKHAFEQANIIKFDELVKGRINIEEKILEINNNIVQLQSNDFKNVLEKIKELLILSDSYLQSIYQKHVTKKLNEIKENIEKNIECAEKDLYLMKETIINNDKNYYSSLYHYGCLIKIKQFDFQEAYEYLNKLDQLQQWDNNQIIDLKNIIDESKVKYQFDLLERKKNTLIKQNQYDDAIDIVNEQSILNIKTVEELNKEIVRIRELKQDYIKLLEDKVNEKLKNEKYNDVLKILEELNNINPNTNNLYEEYYLTAKIGIYEFEEVSKRIREIKELNKDLALKLEEKLVTTREEVSKKIIKAVKEKNYEIFENDYDLRYAKDMWGMPPIMHFILNKDIEGVKILADTFEHFELDSNVIGHTPLNLITLDLNDSFFIEALEILDKDLQNLKKKYKTKSNLSKLGKLAINGVDALNGKAFLSFEVAEITTSAESTINNSLEQFEIEIENYMANVIEENYGILIECLLNPHDFSEALDEEIALKNELEDELNNLKNEKFKLENSFDDELNRALDNKLEEFLYEYAAIELGEKDEFETTTEYNERKRLKVEEIRTSYTENSYIKDKISNLEKEVKENISLRIEDIEKTIEDKTYSYKFEKEYIDELLYILDCKSKADINKVISYYYDVYRSKVEIGTYDADSETFNINANGNENKVGVSRNIAKDFKENFNSLNPMYSSEIIEGDEGSIIQHYFTYEYKDEQIRVLFMTSIIP